MNRKRKPGPAPAFENRTAEDKERMFAYVDKLASRERQRKAERLADAEAWIAEVRARKNQQPKKGDSMKTTIALVLDRSGSMEPLRADTIGGVNNFIKDQQAVPGDCDLTMVQFSTGTPLFIHRATPIKAVAPLTTETYRPGGGTALLDAMGQCIDDTGKRLAELPEKDRPERVIFCVVTDGEENSSQQYTAGQIAEKVKHQTEKYGWQFVFLGANMDSIAAAASLGIHAQAAMNYQATPVGTRKAYAAFSANVASSRTGGALNMDWSDSQRKDNS